MQRMKQQHRRKLTPWINARWKIGTHFGNKAYILTGEDECYVGTQTKQWVCLPSLFVLMVGLYATVYFVVCRKSFQLERQNMDV
jgi:hypothetical protein